MIFTNIQWIWWMYFVFPLDVAPDDILLPADLLLIRISHLLKNIYSFPFYHFIMFCILLSDVHAISMLLCTCIFLFPQFVFIATFPLFAANVSQRQFQSLAWSSASLWHYYQETTEWIFNWPPLFSTKMNKGQ